MRQSLIALFALIATPLLAEEQGVVRSHGISSFGDLKYPADFKHFDYVNPDAPKGGVWSGRGTAASNTFDSLNPFILKGESAQGLGLTFESLLTGSADEPDSAYGLVAHTIEYPEDRSWVIFEMREEATFSDGTPIRAEDVVFSLNILRDKGHPAYKQIYRDIETAEALDPLRVKFTFRDGAPTRDLPMQAGGITILSKKSFENRDFAESSLDPIIGSGRYIVDEVKPGRSISYKRRDDYWGNHLPYSVGTANFDSIVYEYFKDYTAAFEGFKAGAFLFHEEFFSKIWATGYDFPALNDKNWVIKESIPDSRPSGTQGFWINMRKQKFKDIRVRQALGLAFDFEWSNKTLFYGLYTRTNSFWENSHMRAEGAPGPEEIALLEPLAEHLPDDILTADAVTAPVTNGSGADRRVLRRAGKLLDAAGWKVVDGLRRNADGEILTVEFLDDSPTFQRIIDPMIENLKKLGVDASLRLVDPAQYQERQETYDYDVIPGRLVMSLSPGPSIRTTFGSAGVETPGTANFAGVDNPAIDALLETVIGAKTREEMETAVRALDRALRSLHIWAPNWYKASHNIAYWDVFGRPDVKPPYSRGVLGLWWYDEDKAARLKAAGAL